MHCLVECAYLPVSSQKSPRPFDEKSQQIPKICVRIAFINDNRSKRKLPNKISESN